MIFEVCTCTCVSFASFACFCSVLFLPISKRTTRIDARSVMAAVLSRQSGRRDAESPDPERRVRSLNNLLLVPRVRSNAAGSVRRGPGDVFGKHPKARRSGETSTMARPRRIRSVAARFVLLVRVSCVMRRVFSLGDRSVAAAV